MDLQKKYPAHMANVRGQGTYLAFDCVSDQHMKLLVNLRHRGVEATSSGVNSIRFRPMLIFAPKHAAQFLNILEDAVKAL
jgi:4-aminobutyrate aminotransferase/(S)-3-amino-2-methylpropionate transaminase